MGKEAQHEFTPFKVLGFLVVGMSMIVKDEATTMDYTRNPINYFA